MEDVGRLIRVLAGTEPGRWWDVYFRAGGKRVWVGVAEAENEEIAEAEALRQWPFLKGRLIFWERYSL